MRADELIGIACPANDESCGHTIETRSNAPFLTGRLSGDVVMTPHRQFRDSGTLASADGLFSEYGERPEGAGEPCSL